MNGSPASEPLFSEETPFFPDARWRFLTTRETEREKEHEQDPSEKALRQQDTVPFQDQRMGDRSPVRPASPPELVTRFQPVIDDEPCAVLAVGCGSGALSLDGRMWLSALLPSICHGRWEHGSGWCSLASPSRFAGCSCRAKEVALERSSALITADEELALDGWERRAVASRARGSTTRRAGNDANQRTEIDPRKRVKVRHDCSDDAAFIHRSVSSLPPLAQRLLT